MGSHSRLIIYNRQNFNQAVEKYSVVIHFPKEKGGCYYRRMGDCCWFCMVRIAIEIVRAAEEAGTNSEEHADETEEFVNRSSIENGGHNDALE